MKRFTDRYAIPQTKTTDAVELEAVGAEGGANGYTTAGQAEMLAQRLRLGPGDRLLDVGAGRGWPGLHVASAAKCSVVLLDVPRTAAAAAASRISTLNMEATAEVVRGSGTDLPFRSAIFDAVAHSDTL